jgi:hypothetical protein
MTGVDIRSKYARTCSPVHSLHSTLEGLLAGRCRFCGNRESILAKWAFHGIYFARHDYSS